MSLHIYIHVPYCIKKCRYCGFFSIEEKSPPEERYVSAILKEISSIPDSKDSASTIFFGGGTPTLFSSSGLGRIIEELEKKFGFTPDIEITTEANPETISRDYAAGLKAAGFNRVSIGIQSFSHRLTKFLGRIHDPKKSVEAIEHFRRAGFNNINIDMMYAIPTQDLKELETDLKMIENLLPEHVSAYMFSPDTLWAKSLDPILDEDAEQFFYRVIENLELSGYEQYEISNFSKHGYECRHNLSYWNYKPYIGLGAAAVSCDKGIRNTNISDPQEYMSAVQQGHSLVETHEVLDSATMEFERKFLQLRTKMGIPSELMPEGIPSELYRIEKGRAVLTKKGMLLSNEIFQLL